MPQLVILSAKKVNNTEMSKDEPKRNTYANVISKFVNQLENKLFYVPTVINDKGDEGI